MAKPEHVGLKVTLKSSHGNGTEQGEIFVQYLDSRQRLLRSLKVMGLIWGLALVSIFIPLAHFVLVPSFLIAGPIVARQIYQQEKIVLGGKGLCPKCHQDFQIVKGELTFPLTDVCGKCFENVEITPQEID